MASIYKEVIIHSKPEVVWNALKNAGQVHTLFPGVLHDSNLNGDTRTVIFSNGMVVHELIVDINNVAKRFVYAAVQGGITTHHNASWQVFDDGNGGTRFVWISDFMPHSAAEPFQKLVDSGCEALKKTLESGEGLTPR